METEGFAQEIGPDDDPFAGTDFGEDFGAPAPQTNGDVPVVNREGEPVAADPTPPADAGTTGSTTEPPEPEAKHASAVINDPDAPWGTGANAVPPEHPEEQGTPQPADLHDDGTPREGDAYGHPTPEARAAMSALQQQAPAPAPEQAPVAAPPAAQEPPRPPDVPQAAPAPAPEREPQVAEDPTSPSSAESSSAPTPAEPATEPATEPTAADSPEEEPEHAPEPEEAKGTKGGKTAKRKYYILRLTEPGKFEQVYWHVDEDDKMVPRGTPGAKRQAVVLARDNATAIAHGYAAVGAPKDGSRLVAVAAMHFQVKLVTEEPPDPSRMRLVIR